MNLRNEVYFVLKPLEIAKNAMKLQLAIVIHHVEFAGVLDSKV